MPWRIESRGGEYCVIKIADGKNEGCHASRADALKHQRALYANEGSMTASAAPLAPPADWFDQAEPDHAEPLTIEADGRVHGHLAPWGSCHTGFLNGAMAECVQAPRSSESYPYFHLGSFDTEEGTTVPVGKLTYGGPHAPVTADGTAAQAHYDHTGHVGAFVRAKNGLHGIWLSGVLRSDITPEGVRDLKANPPSGDWRAFKSGLELVAALAVPVPGFPIPMAVTASGEVSTLIMQGFMDEDFDYAKEKRDLGVEVGIRRSRAFIRDRALVAASLTTKRRNALPRSAFALPEQKAYPIHDRAHAANALARSAGKPEEARVKAAVCRRFPDMPACSD